MGDFGEGIDQSNNMLGEMKSYNQGLQQHLQTRRTHLTEQIQSAKGERQAEADPKKIAEDTSQFAQVGERYGAARGVLKGSYGGDIGAYAKGLGRTGTETTFGLKPAGRAAGKVGTAIKTAYQGAGSSFKPGAVSAEEGGDTALYLQRAGAGEDPAALATPEVSGVAGGAAEEATHFSAPTEPTPVTGTQPSTETTLGRTEAGRTAPAEEGITEGLGRAGIKVDAAAGDAAAAGVRGAASAAGLAGAVGEAAGKAASAAGVGLGILGGAESLASDMSSGHFKLAGDNDAEKWGNGLSMAGGALDTLGLAVPPLAILGGVVGIASAAADMIGHLEHSSKKAGTATKALGTKQVNSVGVTSLAATGQIASQGSDMLHTINPTGSF